MPEKHPKLPRDSSQRAKAILDLATMDETERAALKRKIAVKTAKAQTPGKRGSSRGGK